MLRDPVKRLVSSFYFRKRIEPSFKDVDLADWLDIVHPVEFNLQTAALCGSASLEINQAHLEMAKANLHYFDFIGFVDRFLESVRIFDRIYRIASAPSVPRLNASPDAYEIPDAIVPFLKDRCRFDVQLIEYGERLYRAKLAAFEMLDSGDPSALPPSLVNPGGWLVGN